MTRHEDVDVSNRQTMLRLVWGSSAQLEVSLFCGLRISKVMSEGKESLHRLSGGNLLISFSQPEQQLCDVDVWNTVYSKSSLAKMMRNSGTAWMKQPCSSHKSAQCRRRMAPLQCQAPPTSG